MKNSTVSDPRSQASRDTRGSAPTDVFIEMPTGRRRYTVLYDDLMAAGISARAWGVYSYLAGRPPGWKARPDHLASIFAEGRDALTTSLRELLALGLLRRVRYRDADGVPRSKVIIDVDRYEGRTSRSVPNPDSQEMGGVGIVAGQPPNPDSQGTGNPDTGFPSTGNPRVVSKEGSNYRDSYSPPPASAGDDGSRPDVEALCVLLAGLIEGNGSKRPTITKDWRTQCRRMLDIDGRDPTKAAELIRWCQADPFWRANIRSMPTLRQQYDALRLRALAEWEEARKAPGRRNGNGRTYHVDLAPPKNVPPPAYDPFAERLAAMDAVG